MPMVAIRTMTSAPFSTGCPAPLTGVRSVAVKPGSTALNLIPRARRELVTPDSVGLPQLGRPRPPAGDPAP